MILSFYYFVKALHRFLAANVKLRIFRAYVKDGILKNELNLEEVSLTRNAVRITISRKIESKLTRIFKMNPSTLQDCVK